MEILLLVLCLGVVLSFEFVNGMNDTANAIAPVIYSHSLKPRIAVIIAAFFNFLWVFFGTAVAMKIVHLLPLAMIAGQSITFGIIIIISILVSAIIWDLGAWRLALPVSSSHALIGSIFGVNIALLWLFGNTGIDLHWEKALEVIEGLLFSPLIGFSLALGLIYLAHLFLKSKQYFRAPFWSWDKPNLGMRVLLIASSITVSFMHGRNDGQKWVGLATLILIIILPATYAINPEIQTSSLLENTRAISSTISALQITDSTTPEALLIKKLQENTETLQSLLSTPQADAVRIRKNILAIQDSYSNLTKFTGSSFVEETHASGDKITSIGNIQKNISALTQATDYVPFWIIVIVSLAIGSGTMIGWKRIVETIGEKIGKYKMNYSQAASSAIITATTIGLATSYGLPVSTTHITSSSVAGTMVEEHGWKNGVDPHMIKHILLAWALTMPTTMLLAGGIFFLLKSIFI